MRFLVLVLVACLAAPAAAQTITISNTTITDTLVVPPGQTGELSGAIDFDNGVLDVQGAATVLAPASLTGVGQVLLSTADSSWVSYCCNPHDALIGEGIEVLGSPGASYDSDRSLNRGVIAAVPGDSDSAFDFTVTNTFDNEGVLEARDGAELELNGFHGRENFNSAGTVRSLPGGVVRFEYGQLSSLSQLGTLENNGKMRFRRTDFNLLGAPLQLPAGDWSLMDGAVIENTTLSVAAGGRLMIEDFNAYWNYNAQPVQLNNATLASDLEIGRLAYVEANGLTLDAASLRFTEYGGRLYLPAGADRLTGTGAVIADANQGFVYAQDGVAEVGAGVDWRANGHVLTLRADTTAPGGEFDLAGTLTADAGWIEVRAPTTARGQVTVQNGGELEVRSSLTLLGPLSVASNSRLRINGAFTNNAAVTITDSALLLESSGSVSSPGTVQLTDSIVALRGWRTLSELTSFTGPGVDYAVDSGRLDLEGATITLGTAPGERWTFSGGDVSNGVINAPAGVELVPQRPAILGDSAAATTLIDIELNADARVTAGTTMSIRDSLSGSGQLTVDGGALQVNYWNDDSTDLVRSVMSRIVPLSGRVSLHGTIDNQNQTLLLPSGVRWGYTHARADGIVGGRVEGEPGAVLSLDDGYGGYGNGYATLNEGVTLAIPAEVNRSAYVRGGLVLENTSITVGAESPPNTLVSRLIFLGEQTLDGQGEIRFGAGDAGNQGAQTDSIEVSPEPGSPAGLTLAAGVTLRAGEANGIIGGNVSGGVVSGIKLTSHGRIVADNGFRLDLYTEDFTQHGVLRSEPDSLLALFDEHLVNEGRIEAAGGVLDFSGALTQGAGAVLAVELSPTLLAAGEAPVLVAGAATLGGLLELSLAEGFGLSPGDAFPLLAAGSVAGGFGGIAGPKLADGLYWQVSATGGDVELLVVEGAPTGDYNSDGVVDAADYTVWRDHLGAPAGSLPNDPHTGPIGAQQYAAWLANYGAAALPPAPLPPAAPHPTPEPAAFVILAWATLAAVSRRRVGSLKR